MHTIQTHSSPSEISDEFKLLQRSFGSLLFVNRSTGVPTHAITNPSIVNRCTQKNYIDDLYLEYRSRIGCARVDDCTLGFLEIFYFIIQGPAQIHTVAWVTDVRRSLMIIILPFVATYDVYRIARKLEVSTCLESM